MLPARLTEGHQHLIAEGTTADVLVQVNGWTGSPIVEEWWTLPKTGTGTKP